MTIKQVVKAAVSVVPLSLSPATSYFPQAYALLSRPAILHPPIRFPQTFPKVQVPSLLLYILLTTQYLYQHISTFSVSVASCLCFPASSTWNWLCTFHLWILCYFCLDLLPLPVSLWIIILPLKSLNCSYLPGCLLSIFKALQAACTLGHWRQRI